MNKLVIFDLDGVLVNTTDLHTKALRDAVQYVVPGEAHLAEFLDASDGIRTKDKLERLKADYTLSDNAIRCIDLCKQEFTIQELKKLKLNESIVKGIKGLRRRGYKIAVASNSRRSFVDEVVKTIGIRKLVDYSISGDEVGSPKPDPEIFLKAIEHFGADRKDVFIFEDSPAGLEAAVRTGAEVIVVNPKILATEEQFSRCK